MRACGEGDALMRCMGPMGWGCGDIWWGWDGGIFFFQICEIFGGRWA
jgi:hypothetical protein